MKLELEHLSPYLPYRLNMCYESECKDWIENWELTPDKISYALEFNNKPILRPLSDLTKEITIDGEAFIPLDLLQSLAYPIDYFEDSSLTEDYILCWINSNSKDHHVHFIPHGLINQLLEWHFNIYNLPSELWVDINTIK